MSIKISIKKNINEKTIKNYVLFCDEKFKIIGLDKLPFNKIGHQIKKSIETYKSDKQIIFFNISPIQKIILIQLKDYNMALENEKKRSKFFNFIKSNMILIQPSMILT